MSGISRGTERQDYALFCPDCGSASVEVQDSLLPAPGDPAKCTACSWRGGREQLVLVPFVHEYDKDEVIVAMMNELRSRIAQSYGTIFGPWLLRWGFLVQPINPKHAAKYAAAIGQSIMLAVINTRKKLAEEAVNGPRG